MEKLRFTEFNYFKGDCFGFSNGQRQIRKALERKGVQIAFSADTELQHLSPHLYNRNCKKSFIMPTHEANNIHESLIKKINEADGVISLCKQNTDVFKNNGAVKPIYTIPQGIDLNTFKFKKKKRIDKLKFLWIGQTSIRKGWDVLVSAFDKAFGNMKDVHLYLKTNGKGSQELIDINDNVTFDSRALSLADLLDLYDDCHVYVSCSRGEATCLPALEAMASGLICMAPPIGGMKEFITEGTAIPLEYEMVDANYGVPTKAPNVKEDDLIEKLRYVYDWYNDIHNYAYEVRNFIETNYCIDAMADKLIDVLFQKEVYNG